MAHDRVVNCPRCGADNPLRNPGILTLVCTQCSTVIYRADAALVAGKQSLLTGAMSGLWVGGRGKVDGQTLEIVGRIRMKHAQGAWEEWYCEDAAGEPVWLIEDEGRIFIETAVDPVLPVGIDTAGLGDSFNIDGRRFQATDIGESQVAGFEGQLPRGFEPDERFRYVDLTEIDGNGRLSIEVAGTEITAFVGRPVPLTDVDFPPPDRPTTAQERGADADCGGCGAGLDIRPLPEPTRTVVCGFCGAVHAIDGLRVSFLSKQKLRDDLHLLVGDKGTIHGEEWEVVGRMVYDEYELDDGAWSSYATKCHEYLMVNRDAEMRTLEITTDGIAFVRKLDTLPDVQIIPVLQWGGSTLFEGHNYRMYERGRSILVYVDGALPWLAKIGDETGFVDCIDRPHIWSGAQAARLSIEWPGGRKGPSGDGEIESSRAIDVPLEMFQAAFPKAPLPDLDLAVLAPNRVPVATFHFGCVIAAMGVLAMLILSCSGLMSGPTLAKVEVNATTFPAEGISGTFTIGEGTRLVSLEVNTNLNNSWTYIEYDLIDAGTGKSLGYAAQEVSFYHGVEGGESWAEGSRSYKRTYKAPPPGEYQLSINIEEGERPVQVAATVSTRGLLSTWPMRAMGFLLLFGGLQVVRRMIAAPKLWKDD
jgi:hypothetical protein